MNPTDLLGLLVVMAALTGITGIIARAVVRYQDRKWRGQGDAQEPAVRAELAELREQLAEQQDLRQRLAELEERLDFTERMLARATHDRLPPGGDPGR